MSKVSIYEKDWLNLVFEGKNKEYGAYQLRQEDSETTIRAFFCGLFFIASISGLGMLLSSFGNTPVIVKPDIVDPVIHVTKFNSPRNDEPKKAAAPLKKEEPKKDVTKKDLINPIITKSTEPVDEVNTNKETKTNPNPTDVGSTSGTSTIPPTTGSGTAPTLPVNGNSIVTTVALDKLPEFPGGLGKFYTYVGNNFEKPELEVEKTISVVVSFVIERDGSMTDIQVKRDPGYGLGKEAIRVLKSLKTKWSPGMIDGKAVRTSYNLPIVVKME
ncbi:MAG: energy transducer TonB [Flavobacterium sp.]